MTTGIDTRTPAEIKRDAANVRLVRALQRGLEAHGFYAGAFDDWAGKLTIAALEQALGWKLPDPDSVPPPSSIAGLVDFRGDLSRVHRWEGHNGRVYWPGGASGVTLDPGFDLGQQTEASLRRHYARLLSAGELDALTGVLGLRGERAKAALNRPGLDRIRIGREEAAEVFPHLAERYWREIAGRFPALVEPSTPPALHTVFLSLAFNRGADNSDLRPLASPLAAGDWSRVADLIGDMQQDHDLAGVRRRRREEAAYIRSALV